MEGEGAGAESTVEAKPRSEPTMEGEGAGSESTVEAKATTESKTASAEADCGKAVTARVRDTEGAPAGKGRRSQRRTGCRNRHGGQTDCYLADHDAHSDPEHPSLYESNSAFLSGLQPCGTVARSEPMAPVVAAYRAGAVAEAAIAAVKNVQYVLKKRPLVSLIDSFVGQLSQVFMLRVFHVGTSC